MCLWSKREIVKGHCQACTNPGVPRSHKARAEQLMVGRAIVTVQVSSDMNTSPRINTQTCRSSKVFNYQIWPDPSSLRMSFPNNKRHCAAAKGDCPWRDGRFKTILSGKTWVVKCRPNNRLRLAKELPNTGAGETEPFACMCSALSSGLGMAAQESTISLRSCNRDYTTWREKWMRIVPPPLKSGLPFIIAADI